MDDNKQAWSTLSTSKTLIPGELGPAAPDIKGIASWLYQEHELVRTKSFAGAPPGATSAPDFVSAGSSQNSKHPTQRVLQLPGEAVAVLEWLSDYLANEWPAEVEPVRSCSIRGTVFVDFVAVYIVVEATPTTHTFGVELVFSQQGSSKDVVRFSTVVNACEQHLQTKLGQLLEGRILKEELLEEDLFSELEDDEASASEDFQALLVEVAHCQSAKMREELLQTLAHLASQDQAAKARLAEAFGSPFGIFAVGAYLQPKGEPPAPLAELFLFAYILRQAASCGQESGVTAMACLRGVIGDVVVRSGTSSSSSSSSLPRLVTRELLLALSFLPEVEVEDLEDVGLQRA